MQGSLFLLKFYIISYVQLCVYEGTTVEKLEYIDIETKINSTCIDK